MAMKYQVLDSLQSHKLFAWVEANRAFVEVNCDRVSAEKASNEIGFQAKTTHIQSVREKLGIVKKPGATTTAVSLKDQVSALQSDIDKIKQIIVDITKGRLL